MIRIVLMEPNHITLSFAGDGPALPHALDKSAMSMTNAWGARYGVVRDSIGGHWRSSFPGREHCQYRGGHDGDSNPTEHGQPSGVYTLPHYFAAAGQQNHDHNERRREHAV
jgi:hypothetical protein